MSDPISCPKFVDLSQIILSIICAIQYVSFESFSDYLPN